MDPKEMIRKKISEQQKLIDTAKAEKRDMSEEEQRQFDTLQGEIEELKRKMEERKQPQEKDVVAEERKRAAEITSLCRDFEIDAEPYISSGDSVEQVKQASSNRCAQSISR